MSSQKLIKAIRATSFCALIGIVLASSGCSTLPITQNQALLGGSNETAASSGVYSVQMKSKFGKESASQGVINGPLTVQTVLERSGAIEKFRDMDITVMRVVEENGQGLKLPVDYQAGKNSVRQEQDYAIHPNDRIVIEAKSNSAIDKIVDSVTGK